MWKRHDLCEDTTFRKTHGEWLGVKGVDQEGKGVKLQRARVLAARNPKLILRRSGLWLRNAHRK